MNMVPDAAAEALIDVRPFVSMTRRDTDAPLRDIPRFKFVLEPLSAIEPVLSGSWLVKGLMPSHGLAAIYGPPGSGKSFIALDVSLHISAGMPWAGRKVTQGGVVYVAAEGGDGFRKRIFAARNSRNIPANVPFALITTAPNLGTQDGDTLHLIECIRTQSAALGFSPKLVVLDTLARTIPGADENSSRDVGLFVANADKVSRDLGCLVAVVHHTGKTVERGMRGSSALHGACDAEWELTDDETGKTVRVAKMKDGQDGLSWHFGLVSAVVGTDEDGDAVTTCVVDLYGEPKVSAPASSKGRKTLTGNRAEFMKVVQDALDLHGEPLPFGDEFPANWRGISRANVATVAIKRGFLAEKTKDSQRSMRSSLINGLAGDGYIGQSKDWVWLV